MDQNESLLENALQEDEKVVWKGNPAPYKLLDADNKKGTLTFWVISIAIAAILSVLYTLYAMSGTEEIKPIVYVFTIGFPLIAFVDPIRDKAYLVKQLLVVTDRRILIVHKNTNNEDKALSLAIDDIDAIRTEEIEQGFSRIRFCKATFGVENLKLRRMATKGAQDSNEIITGLVFYRIANSDRDLICSVLQNKEISFEKKV